LKIISKLLPNDNLLKKITDSDIIPTLINYLYDTENDSLHTLSDNGSDEKENLLNLTKRILKTATKNQDIYLKIKDRVPQLSNQEIDAKFKGLQQWNENQSHLKFVMDDLVLSITYAISCGLFWGSGRSIIRHKISKNLAQQILKVGLPTAIGSTLILILFELNLKAGKEIFKKYGTYEATYSVTPLSQMLAFSVYLFFQLYFTPFSLFPAIVGFVSSKRRYETGEWNKFIYSEMLKNYNEKDAK